MNDCAADRTTRMGKSPGDREKGVPFVADRDAHTPYSAKASKGILRLRITTAKNGAGDGTYSEE